jgi:hypothetical protein
MKLPDIYADAILLAAVFIAALVVATLARAAFAAPFYCPDDALVSCWLRERPELPRVYQTDPSFLFSIHDGGSQ